MLGCYILLQMIALITSNNSKKRYLCTRNHHKRKKMSIIKRDLGLLLITFIGILSVLISLALGMIGAYRTTDKQLFTEAKEAFAPAYQKEQTYRVPFTDIVNTGAVTIESCGTEELQIIRFCPEPDTLFYNNISGLSIESIINHVFVDLREQISPINIHCLADLYSGMLFEKEILVHFVVERFNTSTGEILDTSLLPDKKQPKSNPKTTIMMDISDTESLRAILDVSPYVILKKMTGSIVPAVLFTFIIIGCLCLLYAKLRNNSPVLETENMTASNEHSLNQSFAIGQYVFNPSKNELQGFGETLQLNRKENKILYLLCAQYGNVVERNVLLEENWGGHGVIYSRSLDTYITSLRKYLKKEPTVQIATIKGVGYKIVNN